MTIEGKLYPCHQCGQVDQIHAGQTSIGCQRCERYFVTTQSDSVVYTWNHHNPLRTTEHYGLVITAEDKRNYYESQ